MVLGATPVVAGTVVGVSMSDPSIISDTSGGELDDSRSRMLSDDGRWLVFRSQSADLVPGYNGTGYQVYLYDRQTGTVQLVSGAGASATQGGDGESSEPTLSGDAAFVAFSSYATDLIGGGSGPTEQNVYVWERLSGTVMLVSESAAAPAQRGNRVSAEPVISRDGAYLAFSSQATDLIAGGFGPTDWNTFVWDLSAQTLTLVSESVASPGLRGNSSSLRPVISDDGGYVAFQSAATNLVLGGSGPGDWNVYLWERVSGAATLVSASLAAAGQRGNGRSEEPAMSSDGSLVAFNSSATDLVSGGSGPAFQNVYVWDRSTGATTLVSESHWAAGQRGQNYSGNSAICDDGSYVAFSSDATDLVSGGSGPSTRNVYLWERSSGLTTLISGSVSALGQRGNGYSTEPVFSAGGSFVAFSSQATDLVSGASGPGYSNVYLWENSSETTSLLSESTSGGGQRGDSSSFQATLSSDGSFAAFSSYASDLVSSDGAYRDVFVAEVSTGTLVAASRRDPTISWAPVTGNGGSVLPPSPTRSISDDGAFVTFYSQATDLVSGGSGLGTLNVYL